MQRRVDPGRLKKTFRRSGTGTQSRRLHAALDLEDDLILARLAQVGQVEILRLRQLEQRLAEGAALVNAERADQQRN